MQGGLRAALVLGGAAAVVAGVFFGGRALQRSSEKRDAANAWARFARCLAGDLPATTDPRERIRAIELGVATRKASGAPHERDANWPRRCDEYERKLDAAWAKIDEPGVARTQPPGLQHDHDVTSLWADATRLGPADGATDGVAAPPPADIVLRESTAGGAYSVRMGAQTVTPVSTEGIVTAADPVCGRSLLLQYDLKDDVCVFAGDEDLARTLLRVRCHPANPAIPRGTGSHTLVGLDDGAPPMVAVFDYRHGGVFSVDSGERLVGAGTPTDEGAWGKANGFVATLDRTVVKGESTEFSDTYTLARRLPDGTQSRTALDRPRWVKDHVLDAHVIGGHILWLEGLYQHDTELYAREILEGDPAVGPIVHVGTIPTNGIGKDAVACRTRDALFVELGGAEDRVVLVARKGNEWFPPQQSDFRGGRLTCHGAEATLTAVRPAGAADRYDRHALPLEVLQMRCAFGPPGNEHAASCKRPSVRLTSSTTTWDDINGEKVVATDLEGQVALVTIGDAVLLRSAPIADLDHAPITVVADSNQSAAGGMLVFQANLPTRGDAAVLLLNTARGSIPLRLTAGAKVTPVTVEH